MLATKAVSQSPRVLKTSRSANIHPYLAPLRLISQVQNLDFSL